MLQLERLNGQHRIEMVERQHFDVRVSDDAAVFQPNYGQGNVTLGHRARDGDPLAPLQQRHR